MWTADLQWYQKEKSWSATSLWEQLSWIFLFKHSLDISPPSYKPFFFHIRGFSLALPSSKSCGGSAAPSITLLSRAGGSVKSVPYPSNIVWASAQNGYRISAPDLEILIQQQVLYPVRETASVIYLLWVFFKGEMGLQPIQGLFLLLSHHLPNITHPWFNKRRWDVNPHRAGCQLQGELCCNYAALQPKPAGKVWMLAASLTGLLQVIQIKKECCFYLSCFYLPLHHNFTTFLHGFYLITKLMWNHWLHSVKMYSTSGMEAGERTSDVILKVYKHVFPWCGENKSQKTAPSLLHFAHKISNFFLDASRTVPISFFNL